MSSRSCYLRQVKISVVIPTLNEGETIQAAIQSATAADVEILVVDGGSGDGTRETVKALGVTLLDGRPGRAGQLEHGFRHASGQACVFLHADTRLPTGWAAAVRGALEDPEVAGGAFRFGFERPVSLSLRVVELGARLRVALLGLPYGDQAIFARRQVLDSIGGVPRVCLFEDLDLIRGIRSRGRLAQLSQVAFTSARRHRAEGVIRTALRHAVALLGWYLDLDRDRLRAWVQR